MKRQLLLISALSFSLLACERPNDRTTNASTEDVDNTGRNVRDRDTNAETPLNQGENEADLKVTQNIRKALMNDRSLSTNAKNIKVITSGGVVVLRGVVDNDGESVTILRMANQVGGVKRVNNQLEVKRNG